MIRLVVSFLLSALVSVALCNNNTDIIANIIDNTNNFFAASGTKIELLDFSTPGVLFSNGYISQLNTLEQLSLSRFLYKPSQNDVTYDFNVGLGLNKMNITYDYTLRLSEKFGTVNIDIGKNLFELEGEVSVAGTCSAILKDVRLLTLEGFQAHVLPVFRRSATFELMFNSIFEKDFANLLSLQILEETLTQSFKERFNRIVCTQVIRASRE